MLASLLHVRDHGEDAEFSDAGHQESGLHHAALIKSNFGLQTITV